MKRFLNVCIVVCLLLSGCERRDPAATNPFHNDDTEFVLLIAIDADYVEQNSQPYSFLIYALQTYFDDRQGSNGDEVIFSQLGSPKPVLWHGKPEDFKRTFPSPDAFREFLASKKEPVSGSVNSGLAFSLDYIAHHPSVSSGQARSVTLVVSDMLDPSPSPAADEEAVQSMIRYSKTGGAMGYFFCDQTRMATVRDQMERAGIPFYTLQSDAYGRPPLPSFE